MTDKYSQKIIPVIILIAFLAVLKYYFETSNGEIAVIIIVGLASGILFRLATSYVKPPQWLFRLRFYWLGFSAGIVMAVMQFLTESIESQSYEVGDLWLKLILFPILFIVFFGGFYQYRFKNLKKRTASSEDSNLHIDDFATLKTYKGDKIPGRLLLTHHKLLFYSAKDSGCLFEAELKELELVMARVQFVPIPIGFNFPGKQLNIWVAFPYLWAQKINEQKDNAMVR
jgi:hypothetical protein